MFKRTSHFDQPERTLLGSRYAGSMPDPPNTTEIDNKQLEGWSHTLQQAAYEAGDEGLLVLESLLLDLRDEVVFELHSHM